MVTTETAETQNSYFDGGVLSFTGWSILCFLISLFTLGLGFPWAFCLFQKWKVGHTVVEGKRLKFSGSGLNLFGKFIIWWLLCIITLGIYSFWLFVAMEKWKVKNISFAENSGN